LEKAVKKFGQILAFLLATFSGALAAPNGSIQSDVAICDPNAPFYCEAFAGGTPSTSQVTCTTDGTVAVLAASYNIEGWTVCVEHLRFDCLSWCKWGKQHDRFSVADRCDA